MLWIGCGRGYFMVDSCWIIGGLFLLVDKLVAAGAADSIYGRDDAKRERELVAKSLDLFGKLNSKNMQLKKCVV